MLHTTLADNSTQILNMPPYELHMRQMSILDGNGIHACSELLPSPVHIVCWKMWMRERNHGWICFPHPVYLHSFLLGISQPVWREISQPTQQPRAQQIHTLTHMRTYEHVLSVFILASITNVICSSISNQPALVEMTHFKTEHAKTLHIG